MEVQVLSPAPPQKQNPASLAGFAFFGDGLLQITAFTFSHSSRLVLNLRYS